MRLPPLSAYNVYAATDLFMISDHNAITGARMRAGICISSSYLLLVAVLGILVSCETTQDLERFARGLHDVSQIRLGFR